MGKSKWGGRHAVVIGGSIAGLAAAGVLARHFDQVTVVERDTLPEGPHLRKGVPQAVHAHTLLIRGQQILEGIFPGLTADLLAAGAVASDTVRDAAWYQHGTFKLQTESGLPAITMSRALLEWKVRSHLVALPNVRLRQGQRVLDLLATEDRSRVTGLRVEPVDGSSAPEALAADLVVEAGGRGTRAPQWLAGLGYGDVPVSEVKVNVAYASRLYKLPETGRNWKLLLTFASAPSTRIGVLFPLEDGQWLVTLQAMLGDAPPTDDEGFLEFARSLPVPDLYETLQAGEPLGPAVAHRAPSTVRRHYERMARFPEGFLVVGDAVCSLNPRYGQGMTAAALGAETLAQCLQTQSPSHGFAQRFQRALAKAVDLPWQASTGEDFAYPQTEGKRPPGVGLINWYMRKVIRLASRDAEAVLAFYQVVHLLKPVSILLRPAMVWKVLTQ